MSDFSGYPVWLAPADRGWLKHRWGAFETWPVAGHTRANTGVCDPGADAKPPRWMQVHARDARNLLALLYDGQDHHCHDEQAEDSRVSVALTSDRADRPA